jgi:aryl-alcohol dehydrogenase-like predicted oxidoreductase
VGFYWPALAPDVVDAIVRRSLKGGINWFDTAEAYGQGRSERQLSRALQAVGAKPGEVIVATKWNPFGRTAGSLSATIGDRLAALAPFPIDLHQVHQPAGFSSVEAEMEAMARLVSEKKIRTVGVSNFDQGRMRRAHAALAAKGLPLASNQVKYSLLDRRIEKNGVLAAAKELGVTVIAYSPLEQGLLSGKFHDDPSLVKGTGVRRFTRSFRNLEKSRPLIEGLKEIAKAHGVTPSQVALAWMLQFHGDTVVAIPGASKEKHADENVGAMELTLSQAELTRIDRLAQ